MPYADSPDPRYQYDPQSNRLNVGGQWITAPNQSDPNQVMNNQGDFFSNYSPENLAKLQTLLKPLFDQQRQTLDRAQGSALSDARRSGGAYASSRGYDNANSFISRAQNQVYGQYAPQYDQLAQSQLQAPLGLVGQKMQFDQQRLNNLFKQRDFSYQQEQDKFGWGDVLGGVVGGGLNLLSGGLLGGFGGAASALSEGGGQNGNWYNGSPRDLELTRQQPRGW